jgi:hypothetical protein
MRTQLVLALSILTLTACGGSSTPANDPTASGTTGVGGTVGGQSSPGDPMGNTPTDETKPTSGAPASPMEGKCKSGPAPIEAKDLESCQKGCQGLDDTVPPGSRCVSAKTQCGINCQTKFKKP